MNLQIKVVTRSEIKLSSLTKVFYRLLLRTTFFTILYRKNAMTRKVLLCKATTESLDAENRFAGEEGKWPPSGIPNVKT